MNKLQILESFKHPLNVNKNIFDPSSHWLLLREPEMRKFNHDGTEGYSFGFPQIIPRNTLNGYKLKDGKGFISFEASFLTQNSKEYNPISFIYKYITSEYEYLCRLTGQFGVEDQRYYYNFHYDQDLLYPISEATSLLHPAIHLQVLHSVPRFPVEYKINPTLFIEIIKKTCFDESLNPQVSPPLYMRV